MITEDKAPALDTTASATPPWDIIPASKLSKRKRIGLGSFGVVHKARHSDLGDVALKELYVKKMEL